MLETSVPWVSLFVLGAAHGINPAMGWLFAVGRGLQQRSRRAVWGALGPLAVGHLLAICVAIMGAMTVGRVLPLGWLKWVIAAALLLLGVDGLLRHRHVRLGGMRVTGFQLTTWSFLMASAHGAGLMVLPFITDTLDPAPSGAMHHHHASVVGGFMDPVLSAGAGSIVVTAPLVHTLGYLALTVTLAVVVYEKVGLKILRRAWLNLNLIWSLALVAAAAGAALS